MKKSIAILLIVFLMLGICACGRKESTEADIKNEPKVEYKSYKYDDMSFLFPKGPEYEVFVDEGTYVISSPNYSLFVLRFSKEGRSPIDDYIEYIGKGRGIKTLSNGIRYFCGESGDLSAVRENDNYQYVISLTYLDDEGNPDSAEDEAFIKRVQLDSATQIIEPEQDMETVFTYSGLAITAPSGFELVKQDPSGFNFDYVLSNKSGEYILFVHVLDKKEMIESGYTEEQLHQLFVDNVEQSPTKCIRVDEENWYTVFDDTDDTHYVRSFLEADDYLYQVVQRCSVKNKDQYSDLMVEIAEMLKTE